MEPMLKTNGRGSISQLLNFGPDSYLERTSRPAYAIVFLVPMIIFYEIGTVLVNTDQLQHFRSRVLAFVWLERLAAMLGFDERLSFAILPLIVMVVLAAFQITSGKKWRVNLVDMFPMTGECVLLALPLLLIALLLTSPQPVANCAVLAAPCAAVDAAAGSTFAGEVVTGIGAGIYEEFVFRLVLICLLMMLFLNLMGVAHNAAAIASVLISAALFSAHHHVDLLGIAPGVQLADQFTWPKFIFRTLAGVYFAVLFAVRGFGITAGAHAFYNVLVAFLKADFFAN